MKRKTLKRKDESTPAQRRWLDRLEAVRWDMKPLIISGGSLIKNHQLKSRRGCYATVSMNWIKLEVRCLEKEAKLERELDIANHIGAFI
jgi:hypothetical protein